MTSLCRGESLQQPIGIFAHIVPGMCHDASLINASRSRCTIAHACCICLLLYVIRLVAGLKLCNFPSLSLSLSVGHAVILSCIFNHTCSRMQTPSIVSCTRAGGFVKVLISMMSFLFRALRAFCAASSAGNTWFSSCCASSAAHSLQCHSLLCCMMSSANTASTVALPQASAMFPSHLHRAPCASACHWSGLDPVAAASVFMTDL